jgi:hypothetical protein
MAKTKDRKAGEPCPNCGGDFVVDERQRPETLIARKRVNAAIPANAERIAAAVTAKAAEFGVIHRCIGCGYRERFQPKGQAA